MLKQKLNLNFTTMIASTLFDLHIEGGASFMFPIAILLITNLCLIGYLLFNLISKKSLPAKPLELLKHIGGFALAWGAFGTLVGLFAVFNALEAMTEMIPFNVLCGGLKVALITVLYGFITFLISLLSYIVFKVAEKTS